MTKGRKRGRPPLRMTHRRQQVLAELTALSSQGERITLSRIARACGLCDYREARRIVADLRKMERA